MTVAQQSAYEEVSDSQIFEQTFGSGSSRIRPIVAGWEAGSNYQKNGAAVHPDDLWNAIQVCLCGSRCPIY